MSVPALAMLLLAIGLGSSRQAHAFISLHAARFVSAAGYQSVVLEGRANDSPRAEANEVAAVSGRQVVIVVGSLAFAWVALFPHALGRRLNRASGRAVIAFYKPLRRLQSGIVGDYVAWFITGLAFYGGILLLWRR